MVTSERKHTLCGATCGWVFVTCLSALALWLSCSPSRQAGRPVGTAFQSDVFTIFFTGSELGELKPCGCSGGQLGGLDRRGAILDTVGREARLVVDTGSLVKGELEQDFVKFRIIVEAFKLLDYDLVNLTENDLDIAGNLGLLDSLSQAFGVISARSEKDSDFQGHFTKTISLVGAAFALTIAAFDPRAGKMESLETLFPSHRNTRTINILIVNGDSQAPASVVAEHASYVDCVICPSDSDEPRVIGDPNKGPLVFTVGRHGRYVCRLEVGLRLTQSTDTKGSVSCVRNGKYIRFSAVPVTEDLPQESALVLLYKQYQQLVKESGFLERHLRVPLPDQLAYVGSEACRPCHEYEYDKWLEQSHASAYATLEKVGSDFDPECVVCHVAGLDYEGGFTTPTETAALKDVGCENCHGPGSAHVESLGKVLTSEPKSTCLDCHTPEHSTGYAGNEQLFMEKIVHWKELKANRSVK